MSRNIIEMSDIKKSFYVGTPNELHILKGINLVVKEGEFVSIVGSSGSGKSTLMNIIGALDRPTEGNYVLDGSNINSISDNGLSDIRNKKIEFVFQTFNLIPRSTALNNVELPMLYAGVSSNEREERARNLLDHVGMAERIYHKPNELSGGQKQRVAIVRTLIMNPEIILFDEPTSALDPEMVGEVLSLIKEVAEKGITMVVVSHEMNFVKYFANWVLFIDDGKISFDGTVSEMYGNKDNVRLSEFLNKTTNK